MTNNTTTHQANARNEQSGEPVLYVRTVADSLERYLEASDTSVHWAQAAGAEVSYGPPKLVWPKNAWLCYSFDEGSSEGVIVTVSNQPARNEGLVELIKIKFLRSMKSVLVEATHVVDFFNQLDERQILKTQCEAQAKRKH